MEGIGFVIALPPADVPIRLMQVNELLGTWAWLHIGVDEVEVFESFGGDLPARSSLPQVGWQNGAGDRPHKEANGMFILCWAKFELGT